MANLTPQELKQLRFLLAKLEQSADLSQASPAPAPAPAPALASLQPMSDLSQRVRGPVFTLGLLPQHRESVIAEMFYFVLRNTPDTHAVAVGKLPNQPHYNVLMSPLSALVTLGLLTRVSSGMYQRTGRGTLLQHIVEQLEPQPPTLRFNLRHHPHSQMRAVWRQKTQELSVATGLRPHILHSFFGGDRSLALPNIVVLQRAMQDSWLLDGISVWLQPGFRTGV